jgi:hypothetical protein
MLITMADDETAWLEYSSYEAESTMDPLTVSLNWQWPIRIRGLTHLLAWGKDARWYQPARIALERDLARDDHRGASRAVLGEALGRLLSADRAWVERHAPNWFGRTGRGMTTSVTSDAALTFASTWRRQRC